MRRRVGWMSRVAAGLWICCLGAGLGCGSGAKSAVGPTVSDETSIETDSSGVPLPGNGDTGGSDQPSPTGGSGGNTGSGTPVPRPSPVVSLPLFAPFGPGCGCLFQTKGSFTCEDQTIKGVQQGSFAHAPGQGGRYAVAAPHGWHDASTDLIVANLAPAGGASWGKLIGHSFLGNCLSGHRYNVNRPGLLNEETCTPDPADVGDQQSLRVYERYTQLIDLIAPPASRRLFLEIHGQAADRLTSTIEIAADRVTKEDAQKIKDIFVAEIAKLALPEKVVLKISLEPLNEVSFNTLPLKACGSLHHVAPAPTLHAELPSMLRQESQVPYTIDYLNAVLSRIATEVYP